MNVSEVYQNLYHYTTLEGLYGILKSQSLWATDYRDLNDEKEIDLFIEDKLMTYLSSYIKDIYIQSLLDDEEKLNCLFQSGEPLDRWITQLQSGFPKALLKGIEGEVFVTSFSGTSENENENLHGLLSQWRSYGLDGGFCLVFDTKEMECLMEQEYSLWRYMSLNLSDIVYSDDCEKYTKELELPLNDLLESCKIFLGYVLEGSQGDIPDLAYTDFINCISRYKHFGFREEREVRLMAHLIPSSYHYSDPKEEKVKKTSESNKHYIELFDGIEKSLPIKRIIVGPHVDKKKRATELRTFLKNQNMDDIEVTISGIPYVTR